MKPPRRIWIAIAATLAVAAIVFWFTYPEAYSTHNITWEGYQRIEIGMSEPEVEQVLGAHCGIHCSGIVTCLVLEHWGIGRVSGREIRSDREKKCWVSQDCGIWLTFDANGRVITKGIGPAICKRRTLWDTFSGD